MQNFLPLKKFCGFFFHNVLISVRKFLVKTFHNFFVLKEFSRIFPKELLFINDLEFFSALLLSAKIAQKMAKS